MTTEETGNLLAACASFDNRKVGPLDVIAWKRAIGDLAYEDCESAVIEHYGQNTDRIMPGHIRQRVKAMRADRLAREIVPAPPPELTDEPGRYRPELQAAIRRIADDKTKHLAIAGPVREDPPPPEFTEAREKLGPALPRSKQELALKLAAESRAERAARDAIEQPRGETA